MQVSGKILVVLLAVMLAACQPDPNVPKAVPTGTATVVIGKYEDCTIYRTKVQIYQDVSWVRCTGTKQITTTYNCGKNCTATVVTEQAAEK